MIRGMPRPDLSRHLSDDIDSTVVDTLLETVKRRYYISEKFYQLKASALNVRTLQYHERNVLIGKLNKEHTFEKSIELVRKVLLQLIHYLLKF